MKRDFNLLITNKLTNDIEIVHDFSKYVYGSCDDYVIGSLLYCNLKDYIDKQIPFSLEFDYKSSFGKF